MDIYLFSQILRCMAHLGFNCTKVGGGVMNHTLKLYDHFVLAFRKKNILTFSVECHAKIWLRFKNIIFLMLID